MMLIIIINTPSSSSSLNLQWNSLGLWDMGIKDISDSLIVNKTLTQLDLRSNRIGPQGGVALAIALKKNSTLLRVGNLLFSFPFLF